MSLNIAGSPRYLGCSTNNPSITGAIKSYRMYNTNSATCSVAEITSTNSTIKDCIKMNNRPMDKTQIGKNSTIATIPEENGKNNFDTVEASTSKCGIKLVMMTENEMKNSKLSSPVITKNKLRSLKIKEFNDVISCSLCRGYLINPTTIDCCIHSYCRSCIVKHLTKNKYCPQCGENTKEINLSNIKSDDILKAVVYKLIPGLYQKECEKHLQFNNDNKITDLTDINEEEEYFSPVEPISLSLEYHPVSLEGYNSNDKIGRLQVRYLQCPAAVTVHHLKRFICSKFGIDPKNDKIEINIIYDDEILPQYFSLMDIAYTFKWKRIEPMKFYYQILIHSNKTYEIDCKNQTTEINNEANSSVKRICSVNIQKCVRFKDDIDIKGDKVQNNDTNKIVVPTALIDNTITDKISNNNNDNHNNLEQERITNNDIKQNQNIILKKDKKQLTKSELSKNNIKNKNTELQTTIITNVQNKNDENIKMSTTLSAQNNNNSDFKSLRSNDVRYDFPSSSISTNGNSKTTKTNATTTKTTNNIQNNKISNLDFEISQKPVSKCDIVVSIPQAHIHRASNSSDDSFENLSLAQLKTANKKGAVSPREHTDSIEQQKQDIPKLKIDLPSLKTKFTMPKRVANDSNSETKKSAKNRKLSIEEPQPSTHEVDLTTYAKVIGLKPINPIPDIKRDLNPKNSPDASPASGTSSSGASSVFAFNSEISSTTSHKKRKKGKHSKQSKDGKRRKLHAEISSQPADESLKFKLKLTGNHKMHKSDRKQIDDSANVSTVETKANDEVVVSSNKKKTDVQTNEIVEKKVQLSKNNIDNIQNKQLEVISKQNTLNQNGINQKEVINNKITNSAQYTGNNKIRITTTASSTINNNTNSPKYIPTTAAPSTPILPVTSVPPTPLIPSTVSLPVSVEGNSVKSVGLPNEVLTKSLPQKLLSMHQGPNLPVSPPLPPSLFKTTPMTLQTITTTAVKPAPIQPRMPLHSDIRHQMHMQNIHRKGINNRTTAANFIVPNPPRGIASSAPKTYPINSIASAAHRQAAQFKRSASLDSSPPTLTKQFKLEQDRLILKQDRLIRKSAYASMSLQPTILPKPSTINTFQKPGNQINMNTMPRRTSPPVSIVGTVGNNNNNTTTSPIEQFYYTSPMGPSYTHENNITTTRPILMPPSSVSVTKMTETFAPGVNHPSGLTITPQLHNQQSTPFQFPQSNKPALEIVRILSNIPPADQQKLLVTNNNTIKQNIPTKTTRPPPPPIPLVKIKRSMSQSHPIKSTNINAQQSQNAQINNNNNNTIIEKKSTDVGDSKNNNVTVKLSDSAAQILDLSGKSSRSPSREKSNSPSCLTNSPKPVVQSIKDTSKCIGNNLEAALSKLKQQQQNSSQYMTNSLSQQILNQQLLINNNNNNNHTNDDKSKQTTNNNDNSTNSCLQNLQLLSESATNREKIIINTQQQQQRTLPKLPKLNEISKMRGNATVRQQNASIRNIPNPSALVFRNNQQIPMLASITKTSASITPPKLNTISTNSTVISDLKIIDSNKICLTSSTTADPSKIIASKKNLNIEQLAANLNMRAAAAAGDNTTKNIETPITKLSATSPSVTPTPSSEQNNITVSSSNSNTTSSSSSSSYTTIPLMAVSSTTTSPVTVVSSAS